MQFDFSTASRIIFGPGKISLIPDLVKEFSNRILVISGAPQTITDSLLNSLRLYRIDTMVVKVESEPTIDSIRSVLEAVGQLSPLTVIGIGGGSAIDTAKVVSSLLNNPGDIIDYLEVIGQNKPLTSPALPLIAIPTTAGTGSEVTRNAVIGSPAHHIKVSLRSQYLLPRIALIDPQLTLALPSETTAFTGLDALTQLIEPYTSNSANPITDALCIDGIQRIGSSLYRAYDVGMDLPAREDMSIAALLSGISLANAKLGAVHGFAGVIGGEIHAHHGAICACLLANVMEANISALSTRSPGNPVLDRYANIGRYLTGNHAASSRDGIDWIRSFCHHARIQSLSQLGLNESQFPIIIEKAQKASSMKGNPIPLTQDDLYTILTNS